MELTLYRTTSERNRMDKILTDAASFEGQLRNGASILAPVITLAKGEGIMGLNYAYIPKFSRYYYITDITSLANGLWQVSLSVDVLMSWKTYIKEITAVAERSENVFNLYLPDNEWKSDVRSLVQYREIGGFKAFTPIIVVAGSTNETQSGGG